MRARQVSRENHIQPTNAALDKPQAGVLGGEFNSALKMPAIS